MTVSVLAIKTTQVLIGIKGSHFQKYKEKIYAQKNFLMKNFFFLKFKKEAN